MKTKIEGNASGYGFIHEEYVERESERNCFKRHEISLSQWQKMTSSDELRFWKARGVIRNYTEFGYMVIGHSRRRWGDGLKVIDRFKVVKTGAEFDAKNIPLEDFLKSRAA